MLKTWTRCENTGDAATDEVARSASRSLRRASKITVSSVEGGGGVGGVAVPLFGEEEPCFGGDGVSGRRLVGTE
jgi:hypothetical protein